MILKYKKPLKVNYVGTRMNIDKSPGAILSESYNLRTSHCWSNKDDKRCASRSGFQYMNVIFSSSEHGMNICRMLQNKSKRERRSVVRGDVE